MAGALGVVKRRKSGVPLVCTCPVLCIPAFLDAAFAETHCVVALVLHVVLFFVVMHLVLCAFASFADYAMYSHCMVPTVCIAMNN